MVPAWSSDRGGQGPWASEFQGVEAVTFLEFVSRIGFDRKVSC